MKILGVIFQSAGIALLVWGMFKISLGFGLIVGGGIVLCCGLALTKK